MQGVAYGRHTEIVQELISAGADVDHISTTVAGKMTIHLAAWRVIPIQLACFWWNHPQKWPPTTAGRASTRFPRHLPYHPEVSMFSGGYQGRPPTVVTAPRRIQSSIAQEARNLHVLFSSKQERDNVIITGRHVRRSIANEPHNLQAPGYNSRHEVVKPHSLQLPILQKPKSRSCGRHICRNKRFAQSTLQQESMLV